MSLEAIVSGPWPPAIVEKLDVWQQGDVLDISKQVGWVAPSGTDPITGLEEAGDPGSRIYVTAPLAPLGLGVITSQTCDVIGVGQGAKHPTVQVSPLVHVTDNGDIANLTARKLVNHVRVTEPAVCGDDVWAVDLRISFPISKAFLLAQERRSAFVNEADALEFAERLAMKAGRASFHDVISSSLAGALGDSIGQQRTLQKWTDEVEQFRIGIREGTRLTPRSLYVLVVTDEPVGPTVRKLFEDSVSAWAKANKKNLRSLGINIGATQVRAVSEIGLASYRGTTHLTVPELGRPYYP